MEINKTKRQVGVLSMLKHHHCQNYLPGVIESTLKLKSDEATSVKNADSSIACEAQLYQCCYFYPGTNSNGVGRKGFVKI